MTLRSVFSVRVEKKMGRKREVEPDEKRQVKKRRRGDGCGKW